MYYIILYLILYYAILCFINEAGGSGREIHVVVPASATMWDVKAAAARLLGNDDILQSGRLVRKQGEIMTAYRDSEPLGSRRRPRVCARLPRLRRLLCISVGERSHSGLHITFARLTRVCIQDPLQDPHSTHNSFTASSGSRGSGPEEPRPSHPRNLGWGPSVYGGLQPRPRSWRLIRLKSYESYE